MFIDIEGIDGSGKSTLASSIEKVLSSLNYRDTGTELAIDATFASPVNQNPLTLVGKTSGGYMKVVTFGPNSMKK